MIINSPADCRAALEPLPEKYAKVFSGEALLTDLFPSDTAHTSSVLLVRFEAGARNHWHWHTGGQLLYITEGEGYVQVRGQEPTVVRAGDIVACPPGEQHWHGATAGSAMTHLAVTLGDIIWLEPSGD
ncbi:cupin domain-containing protein [Streptomyces yaizuensis]|uniref:Cupin domain-containing protein n=1 Tax=Streptomyces yaizuensis TaxID=2989713 RepID=A0ABQ5NS78_9ACTN|nr:cupin domain-containing protein [Streptomyces sp. YSPA8]GLF93214.1 cupin domain-containing protein [Streptomyces sp. YSPA8]